MAGTSGDGIDAACVRIHGRGEDMKVRLLCHRHRPFPPAFRRRLLATMAPAETTTQDLARLHTELGERFGRAARHVIDDLPRRHRPSLVGLAGQTICHLPSGRPHRTVTLQLGSPAHVAAIAGCPVAADFRQTDVAAGGQGAPLVPWTDWVLFRHPRIARAVQNIGGIGNVTWIPAGARASDVIAFDTGPGNMVIDELMARVTGGRQRMDRGGRLAARGRVIQGVLDAWLSHPYFRRRPPKTTGRELFGRPFVDDIFASLKEASDDPADWIATATAFTAASIGGSYRRFLAGFAADSARSPGAHRAASLRSKHTARRPSSRARSPRTQVILAGGGANNTTLRTWPTPCPASTC